MTGNNDWQKRLVKLIIMVKITIIMLLEVCTVIIFHIETFLSLNIL